MTPEELASTMEGHAESCDQHAVYHRNRERHGTPDRRQEYHDYAVRNEAMAATLREWAQRVRTEMADLTAIIAQTNHYVKIDDKGWVIEHSIGCRFAGIMESCEYTEWVREHLNGSRVYPHGRFLMNTDDPHYMALEPA